jgi:hypothetical protein
LGIVMVLFSSMHRNGATNVIWRMRARGNRVKNCIPFDDSNFVSARILVGQILVKADTLEPSDVRAFVEALPKDKSPDAADRERFLEIVDEVRNGDVSRIYEVGNEHAPASAEEAPAAAASAEEEAPAVAEEAAAGAVPVVVDGVEWISPMGNPLIVDPADVPYLNKKKAKLESDEKAVDIMGKESVIRSKEAVEAFDLDVRRKDDKDMRALNRKRESINELKAAEDEYFNANDDVADLMGVRLRMALKAYYTANPALPAPKTIAIRDYTMARNKVQSRRNAAAAAAVAIPAFVLLPPTLPRASSS